MVKLGQLFLDGGRWEGKQIVPQEWVEEATTQQIDAGDLGYGYQWWTGDLDGDRSFQAWGAGGQVIVVVPSRDLVVADHYRAPADRCDEPRHRRRRAPRDHRGRRGLAIPAHELIDRPAALPQDLRRGQDGG